MKTQAGSYCISPSRLPSVSCTKASQPAHALDLERLRQQRTTGRRACLGATGYAAEGAIALAASYEEWLVPPARAV